MATAKSTRSVTTTPQSPEVAEYTIVTVPAIRTVVRGSRPRSTPPILVAASVTVAMMITLKTTPR